MHHIYFIRGLNNLQSISDRDIPIKNGMIFDRSNHDKVNLFRGVARMCLMHKNLASKAFIASLVLKIKASLKDGHEVSLLGHSYGGMIVNKVSRALKDHPQFINIHIMTFGSIQIIKPHPNMIQFMTHGDMAIKCVRKNVPDNLEYDKHLMYTVDGKPIHIDLSYHNNIMWIKPTKRDWFGWINHFEYPIQKITNGIIKL